MSDTERVRAWRDRLKQAGRVPMTIWVTAATKARYEDLALTYRRSPSELAQQALDAYRPDAAVSATAADMEQLRTLIRAELAQMTGGITDTVTATVTATMLAQLPHVLQTAVADHASVTVAETTTITPPCGESAAPHKASATDTAPATLPLRHRQRPPDPPPSAPEAASPRRRGGRPASPERQQILTLLQAHPEGLSAEELRVYLKTTKRLGDVLQGMRRTGVLRTRADGKTLRYMLASPPQP
jgi:hypothetical protein